MALVIAVALVAPVLAASIASPASADVVVNGCTVVSNPTPTHFTNCPNMAIGSLAGLNLSYANFAGSSFAGCDSASCSASDLSGVNLTGANLSGAQVFDSVVVQHRPFPPSIVSAAANFTGATLRGANATNVNFAGANLTNANLTGANLTGASFEATDSEFGVTLDATLTGANFTGTLVVPSNQSVGATSQAGAVVTWPTPPSLPGAGTSCNAASGSTFPLFGTTVTCQVGAGGTATFQVSVASTTKYFTRIGIPSKGAILAGQESLDAAAGDAPGVTKVVFELSGGTLSDQVIATATPTIYGWLASWDTSTVPDGNYSLQSVATDKAANTDASTVVPVTVYNHPQPPATTMLVPAGGATVSGGAQLLDASASSLVGIAKVVFQLTGGTLTNQVIGTGTPTIYGELAQWNTLGVPNGTYTLQSVATDQLGSTGSSAPISVTVNNPPPTTSVLIPSNGATQSENAGLLDATAGPNVSSVFFELSGGTLNDQVIATGTLTLYGWLAQWNTTSVPNGTYTLQSVASYPSGLQGTSAGISLTVDNGATAFVVNNVGNTVTPISLATHTAGAPIPVGHGPATTGAEAIALTPDHKTAYVVDTSGSAVTPVNTETDTAGTAISVGTSPLAIAMTPNGATAYVVNNGDNTVTPIDTSTNTAGTPIPVGSDPLDIALTPDGATAYVANSVDNTVTPIDTATNVAGPPIAVGSSPQSIAISPDGATAYVVNFGGSVTPIDTATNTPGAPIPVGTNPHGMFIAPNGTVAYVDGGAHNTLTPIDLATNTAEAPITVGQSNSSAVDVVFSPDGSTAYVSVQVGGSISGNAVTLVSTATNTVGTSIPLAGTPAGAMAITPDGGSLFVIVGDAVIPIDTATMVAGASIPVGQNPVAIAIS